MPRFRTAALPVLLLTLAGSAACAQPELHPGMSAADSHELIESMRPTNAALIYYRLWMTADPRLSETHLALNDTPDDDGGTAMERETAAQLLADSQKIVEDYIEAASLEDCDFGIAYQDGWNASLPHLGKLRATARLLDTDARRLLDAGEADAAAERAGAIYGLAWQARGDKVLISSLVSVAIANLGHQLTRDLIDSGEISEAQRDALVARLERFEAAEDTFNMQTCIAMEAALTAGWIDSLVGEQRLGDRLAADGFIPVADESLQRELNALTKADVRREAERMADYYKRVDDVWEDPDAADKMAALAAVVQAGGFGPLARSFCASLDRGYEAEQRAVGDLLKTLGALQAYRPAVQKDEIATIPADEQ